MEGSRTPLSRPAAHIWLPACKATTNQPRATPWVPDGWSNEEFEMEGRPRGARRAGRSVILPLIDSIRDKVGLGSNLNQMPA